MTDRAQDEQVWGPVTSGAERRRHPSPAASSPPPPPDEVPIAALRGHEPFGAMLEDALRDACGGRLSPINWFRTDWQRGGALTGYATFDADDGHRAVVTKMPVPPGERRWLADLQPAGDVAPRLFAHGETLGGYDIAWVVMERLPHGPLGPQWDGAEFDLLIDAAGRFYAAAAAIPLRGEPPRRPWAELYEKARKNVHDHALPQEQRWKVALKKAHRKLRDWCKTFDDRPADHWCHGDLHLGNALTRDDPPAGPALLIDYAQTHVGCWVDDALYFEHLFWARPQWLAGRKLCKALAHARRDRGLPVDPHWADHAAALRGLIAMSTPARLYDDGNPAHLHAALETLESCVR